MPSQSEEKRKAAAKEGREALTRAPTDQATVELLSSTERKA